MKFLSEILGRPSNERPFVLIPVGKAAADAQVPGVSKGSDRGNILAPARG